MTHGNLLRYASLLSNVLASFLLKFLDNNLTDRVFEDPGLPIIIVGSLSMILTNTVNRFSRIDLLLAIVES